MRPAGMKRPGAIFTVSLKVFSACSTVLVSPASVRYCIKLIKGIKLNDNKTELMLVTSKRSKHLHSLPTSITIGNAKIPFKKSVKNLGFTLDCSHVHGLALLLLC